MLEEQRLMGKEQPDHNETPHAHPVVCDAVYRNTSKKMRKARYIAKRTFCSYNLNRLIIERDYMTERNAILERVAGGISAPIGRGYDVSDPTLRKIPELESLRRKYHDFLWRNQVVDDVLSILDDDTAKLVRLIYINGKSIAWVMTHSEETGLWYSERTIRDRLMKAKDLLARRMGLI